MTNPAIVLLQKEIMKFQSGDRVEGLYSHKGKTGTVIMCDRSHAYLHWDGGKRPSNVELAKIKPLENELIEKEAIAMALFTASGLSYQDAIAIINDLKQLGIEANITSGGIAIHPTPDQVNQAREICSAKGASFSPGYSMHQEEVMLRCGDMEHLKQVTSDAIAIIKEWK